MSSEIIKREGNHRTVGAGIDNVAGTDILMLRVDPTTNRLLVAAIADSLIPTPATVVKRDENHKPTFYGISSVDGVTLVPIRTDEDGNLLGQFT
jgi:hypothetical protein